MLIPILVGAALGFLSGLGIGGGSLLILWLTLMMDYGPAAARSTNLLFFIPAALIASLFRWRQGALPFRKIVPAIVSGCAAAFVFSLLSANLNTQLLKKLFGILLLATGIREVFYKPKM